MNFSRYCTWCVSRKKLPIILIGIALLVRLVYCVQVPVDTSDLYRHLGFTAHFWENPGAFYWLKAEQFPKEFWSQFWSEQGYIYPPLALLFFSLFGSFGIGLFWVKLALTMFDIASAVLIGRSSSWWAALLVFSAPVSVWYTSHEGQYESIVNFLILVTVLSLRNGRWMLAGAAFMLALQSKQLAILIAPYLLFELGRAHATRPSRGCLLAIRGTGKCPDSLRGAQPARVPLAGARAAIQGPPASRPFELIECPATERLRAVKSFALGFAIAFLPFIPFYCWRHDLWFLPLQSQDNVLNPFYWPFFWSHWVMRHFDEVSPLRMDWNAVVTTAPLLILAIFLLRGHFFRKLLQALPSIGFWMMIKSVAWAMNWYVNVVPGLTFALWRYRRWMILLLAFYWLQCGQQVASYVGDDDREEDETIVRFHECVWHCDYRAKE